MALKVWLPLDGDLRNLGTDNITFTQNTGATVTNTGKIGQCYSFDGNDNLLQWQFDKTKYDYKPISVACWFKCDKTKTGAPMLDMAADLTLSYTYSSSGIKFGCWRCYANASGTRVGASGSTSAVYNADVWHHVAVVFGAGKETIYVDGKFSQEIDHTASYTDYWHPLLAASYNKITLAKSTGTSNTAGTNYWMGGLLNDVRIYDHCLSAAEVHEIAQGLVVHYKLDGLMGGLNENLISGNKTSFNSTSKWQGTGWASEYISHANLIEILKPSTQYTFSWNSEIIERTTVPTKYSLTMGFLFYSPSTSSANRSFYNNGQTETGVTWHSSTTFTTPDTLPSDYRVLYYTNRYTTNGNSPIGFDTVQFSNIKLELGDKETAYCPSYNDMHINTTIVTDSSGYGYNGNITGTLTDSSDTPRYNSSTYFDGSSYLTTAANTLAWYQMEQGTLACWMKPTADMTSWRGSWGVGQDGNQSTRSWAITDYANTFRVAYTNGSTYVTIASDKALPQNEWHHCAATLDGTTVKMYFDGELVKTATLDWGTATMPTATRMELGVDLPGTDEKFTGNYSDARFYVTPLLDTDIKMLYNTSMRVDNLGNTHVFKLNENSTTNNLTKAGILNNNAIESYLTLPDGSNWKLLLYHYVDNGNNLFTSANATDCNEFGLYSQLKYIDNYLYDGKYEFYVIQDGKEFRWTQTSNPTASSITGKTVVSGYSDPVRGLAKANQSNTYIGYGSWWGACGCWTSYSAGGKTGIPGFGPASAEGICEKYLALYARIEKTKTSLKSNFVEATEFIEM